MYCSDTTPFEDTPTSPSTQLHLHQWHYAISSNIAQCHKPLSAIGGGDGVIVVSYLIRHHTYSLCRPRLNLFLYVPYLFTTGTTLNVSLHICLIYT